MTTEQVQRKRHINWDNIIFFAVTTLPAVIGAPIYLYQYGVTTSEIFFFWFYVLATGMSITGGYHRLFAHQTYKAHPIVQFLVLFFGAAAFEQSALKWCSQHRDHHRFVDSERDPYNIKYGFFYAHMGWLMFWKHRIDLENAKDLQANRMLMNQHRYYMVWAFGSGVVIPLIIGALTGHLLGAFLLTVCARITLVYHATFFINSLCHTLGTATYDASSTAKDHWLVAILTNGEGYHNFHHRFPNDYRNGIRWYHWDPTKWVIALLSFFGLTWELQKTPEDRITEARLKARLRR